jgi:hypothetical protein
MNLRKSATAFAVLATMTGCALFGSKVDLSSSPSMPAAEGSARFGTTKNDNTSIVLHVKHLAHPEKLTPPASSYVVWTRANKDAAPQSIGALKVDSDLAGSLFAETPLKSFELFVTAEASGEQRQPTGVPLLWTNYSR